MGFTDSGNVRKHTRISADFSRKHGIITVFRLFKTLNFMQWRVVACVTSYVQCLQHVAEISIRLIFCNIVPVISLHKLSLPTRATLLFYRGCNLKKKTSVALPVLVKVKLATRVLVVGPMAFMVTQQRTRTICNPKVNAIFTRSEKV